MVETYGKEEKALQNSVKDLTTAMNSMINLLKNAEKEVSKGASQDQEMSKKLDKLVAQNKDMAKALVLLLELNREHLPKIAAHTGESTRLMKKPAPGLAHGPAPRPRPRPDMRMPLPPEPGIATQEPLPSIPRPPQAPPAPAPKKKRRGLFGFGKK